MQDCDEPELTKEELLGWAEFCCWSALVMAPFIYWIQGPSVSQDQFVVRTALVVIVSIGAIAFRARAFFHGRRSRYLRGQLHKSADAPGDTPR